MMRSTIFTSQGLLIICASSVACCQPSFSIGRVLATSTGLQSLQQLGNVNRLILDIMILDITQEKTQKRCYSRRTSDSGLACPRRAQTVGPCEPAFTCALGVGSCRRLAGAGCRCTEPESSESFGPSTRRAGHARACEHAPSRAAAPRAAHAFRRFAESGSGLSKCEYLRVCLLVCASIHAHKHAHTRASQKHSAMRRAAAAEQSPE